MPHGPLDGVPAGNRVIAVHLLAWDTKALAAVDDALFAVLGGGGGRDSPLIVHHDHQQRQFITRPGAPDQTRSEGEFVLGRYTNGSDRDTLVSVYSLLMSEK